LTTFEYKNIANLSHIYFGLPEDNNDPLFSLPKGDLAICAFGEIKYKRRKSEYIKFFCDYGLTWYMYVISDGINTVSRNYGFLFSKSISH
jgi:hypothetical protein